MTAENRPRTRNWESQKFFGLPKLTELWQREAREGGGGRGHKKGRRHIINYRTNGHGHARGCCPGSRGSCWRWQSVSRLSCGKPNSFHASKNHFNGASQAALSLAGDPAMANGKGSQRQAGTHTQADTQNGCCCGTKSVMAHEKLPGHAQDFIIMCLGRKTMAALAAAAPHAGATAIPKNESRIVRLNVSGGFHFSRAEQSGAQSRARSTALQEWQPLRLWPETKRIRWRKLK